MNQVRFFLIVFIVVFCSSCKRFEEHDFVDLGLPSGTLWATYNVGASLPSESGELYSWGESAPKTYYSKSSYVGGIEDAATVNWGDEWRMPYKKEMEELIKGCKWTWTDNYEGTNAKGVVGTSLFNKKSIFFPACEFRYKKNNDEMVSYHYGANVDGVGVSHLEGSYFLKDIYENGNSSTVCANSLSFSQNNLPELSHERVEYACNVRAVRCKKIDNKQKDCPAVLKESFALSADSVEDFHVVGDYNTQTLTVSGYFNCNTDWTYKYMDTLSLDGVLFLMVRGENTGKNYTDPHKSDFFNRKIKISKNIDKVVFGPTLQTLWIRKDYEYELTGDPVAEMIDIISSTDLNPYYKGTYFNKKEEDKVFSKRCKDTTEFASILPDGFLLNEFIPCDVNKDGYSDYLIVMEGPYEEGKYPKLDEYEEGENWPHVGKGIMLVINENDTAFVSDIWNQGCLTPDDDPLRYFSLSAKDDYLDINDYNSSNRFVYRDGNYQLVEIERKFYCGENKLVLGRHIDLDKGYEELKEYKTEFPYWDLCELVRPFDDDKYYFMSKFKIKRHSPHTLTNMKEIYLSLTGHYCW